MPSDANRSMVTVELFGMARRLTGVPAVRLPLAAGATLRDLNRALTGRFPQLAGRVIDPASADLIAPNVYQLDGRAVLPDLDRPVAPGEPLCLMFVAAGG